ncbi:glycosyltransferase family 2 protein [Streptococcus mutans]|uniref:glycosyltransferase family 2 protein n=1 Tax=Streptococcus mutans TaxID=1309 RepID=UPI0038BD1978
MVKVSIICTNYNKGSWIGEAIDSFLKQETSFPYEIIIVDDASTDHSVHIIKTYQKQYPDLIRAFFNQENQGITKTWSDICKKARGQYIARCDGDDYWIDPFKLQKQIDLLETSPESKWSNTDFDMVDSKGNIIHKDVLKNNIIPFMDSYEKMLALKGMTMASTWLVETKLMLEINDRINKDAVDDTFNIQLELFKKTKLAFLRDSTTVYRMDAESDSRSKDSEKLAQRFDRLLETQLEYIEKYPDSDYKKVLEYLLPKHNDFEKVLAQDGKNVWNNQQITIYLAKGDDQEFSEENCFQFPLQHSGNIQLTFPENIRKIRIDLSEIPSYYRQVSLVNTTVNTELLPTWTNAKVFGYSYYFIAPDPQMIYDLTAQEGQDFKLTYEWFNVDQPSQPDFLANHLVKELDQKKVELKMLSPYKYQYQKAVAERDLYLEQLNEMVVRYNSVTHSRRWTIPTKIINLFRRKK